MSGKSFYLAKSPLIPGDVEYITMQGTAISLAGNVSGSVYISPSPITTSYALTLPSAQGLSSTFLKNNGSGELTWSPAVVGPATATDNAITRFDSTTGSLVQNSTVTVSDTADVAGVKTLAMNGATSGTLTVQPAATTTSYTITLPPAQGALNYFLRNDGFGNLSWAAPAPYVAGNFFFGDIGGGTSGPIATGGDFTSCTKTNGTFGNGASYFVVTWTPRSATPKSFAANYYSIGSTNSDDNNIIMPFMTAIGDGSITLVCEETGSSQNTGMMLTIFY